MISVVAVAATAAGATSALADQTAPGSPGRPGVYQPADKQGFGTAHSTDSPLWFTMGHGGTGELYYPNLSTPASRTLQVVITDGKTFAQRLSDVPTTTQPVDAQTPSYRQVSTGNGWTATATYTTDPTKPSMMVDLQVKSTSGTPLQTYVIHEPTLNGNGSDDSGTTTNNALVAYDKTAASALTASPGFTKTSTGYLGTSDGWTDLSQHKTLTATYSQAGPGSIGQVGQIPLDGVKTTQATLTLSYGGNQHEALSNAQSSSDTGFGAVQQSFTDGWHRYVGSLKAPPASLADAHEKDVYYHSLVTLSASEDKHNPGAFVAAPNMPWGWGTDPNLAPTPGPYHLVWPRDLYQMATSLIAAGDTTAANRALNYLESVQQPDGHFAQNTTTAGKPFWTGIQMDEQAFPIVLAWQLGRTDPPTQKMVKSAANYIVNFQQNGNKAPWTQQERWENQSGYSPGTTAAEIAGLVCGADLLQRTGDTTDPQQYRSKADTWAKQVQSLTATSNGPLSPQPYYLRLTKDGQPNQGTQYNPGDNYPGTVDQRTQVDPSFLELVRLGIKAPSDPVIRSTLPVIDRVLGEQTPSGHFWHRFTNDGYGEKADGSQWDLGQGRTYGRLWPIFAGERGEYDLLNGDKRLAAQRLAAMAATANQALLLPEQVWDNRAPAGGNGIRPGTPTMSSTPLAWTHAQFIRLAWSLQQGSPVEQPSIVAQRYIH